jgi:CRP-like cAMP-binding protein
MEQRNPEPVSRPALRLFLSRLLARSSLGPPAQQALLNLPGRIAEVRRNQDFVGIGTRASHACLVMDGLTARWGGSLNGQRQITALHVAGDMPDLYSLMLPEVTFGLQALSTTTILCVPHIALREAASIPEIAQAFWRDCTADAAIASEWVVNVGRRKAKPRIAHLVCEIATRLGMDGGNNSFAFHLPLTQTHIGGATGLSTVHVNRSLQELKKAGLAMLGGAEAQVLDWKGLKTAADFDPAYLHIGKKA